MDLRYSVADEDFRSDLRAWLDATLPSLAPHPPRDAWPERRKWDTDWQRRLFDAGYAGLHWPKEYGGRGASPTEQLIFYEETTRAKAPYVGVNFVGTLHAGPTLVEEGTDVQKATHLPRILCGDEVWCQGFSEPGAGSDLAGLRTRADRDGDDYVLNGQKIWCSFGQVADVGEFLVRTDPDAPKHRGISWLILPMDLPGIEVRPLKTVLGSSEFAEVFLTDVRVPVANRVGAENDGWRVTNVTLKYERGTAFVSELIDSLRLCDDLAPLVHDAAHRRELGHVRAQFEALWALSKRNVSQSSKGAPGPGAVVVKLAYTEARQQFGELCLRVLERDGLHIDDNELVEERLRTLALTIAAGASQIQRNIISERVLGMPPGTTLMDLDLDVDQIALRDGIAALLAGRFDSDRVRGGFDRAMYDELAAAGVFSLRADGFAWADAAIVFEQLGHACVPGPLVGCLLAGTEAACVVEHATPLWIDHLEQIDAVLVLDGAGVVRFDARTLDAEPAPWPLDPLTPVSRVDSLSSGAPVDADAAEWRRAGAVLTAAFQLGLADRLLEMAVAYAKERVQFDRPIASFQAIKHMCADMCTRTEVARAAVYAAAAHLDAPDLAGLDRSIAVAKLVAGEAAIANGKAATQVHGGMGFTWEVDVHLFLKRAWVLDTQFGSADQHADRMVAPV